MSSSLPPLPTFPSQGQSANFAANRPPPLTLHSPDTPANGSRARYSTLPTPFPNSPSARQNISNSPVSPNSEHGSNGMPVSLSSEGQDDRANRDQQNGNTSAMDRQPTSVFQYPAIPQSTTPKPPAYSFAPPQQEQAPPLPPLPTLPTMPSSSTAPPPPLPALPQLATSPPPIQLQQPPQASPPRSPISVRGHPEGEIRTQTIEFAFELPADPSPPQSGHLREQSQQNQQYNAPDPDLNRRLSYINTPPGSPPIPPTPHTPRLPYTQEEPPQPPEPHPNEFPQFYTNFRGAHQPPPLPAPIYVPPAPTSQLKYPAATETVKAAKPKRFSTSSSTRSMADTYAHGALMSCLLHPLIAIWACISPCTLHTSTQKLVKPDSRSSNGFCGSLLFLPIYPFATLWRRMEIREKYGLRSGGLGEVLGALCACWCLVVQDYTEVRRREAGRGRARPMDLEMGNGGGRGTWSG